MKRKIHIITIHDLVKYPPLQSLILILLELGVKVKFIGYCSDKKTQEQYEDKGVEFIPIHYLIYKNNTKKFINQIRYKKQISRYIKENYNKKEDLVWFDYTEASYVLHKILDNTDYIIHFYEFVNFSHWKYRLIYPTYKHKEFIKKAVGIIHCEYNRAHILRGLCGLDKLPFIIPNKPYFNEIANENIPQEVNILIKDLKARISNKKIILYQGIFNSNERRLEEFCEAVNNLSKEFVLLIMGEGNDYYHKLKIKYENDNIIFIPFIKPPFHLLITQLAHIGILTYFPMDDSYAGVLNPLYCAPNKIFEYGKYGIPMISNDLPGITSIFKEYHCGEAVQYPINEKNIKESISKIMNNYDLYKGNSKKYYDSINLKIIIKNILSILKFKIQD